MSITLTLTPELERQLAEAAARRHQSMEEYCLGVLSRSAAPETKEARLNRHMEVARGIMDRYDETFRELAK